MAYNYSDLGGRTRVLIVFLVIYMVIYAIAIISDIFELMMINEMEAGTSISDAQIGANDLRQGTVGLLQILIFIITGIIFLRWIYRASANAHALSLRKMKYTPAWSVGWYFIPIANLYKPYKTMQEICQVSISPDKKEWALIDVPIVVAKWWGLWLLSNALGQISFRLSMSADTLAEIKNSGYVTLASDFIEIPLCLAAISLVKLISTSQLTTRPTTRPFPVE